MPIVAEGSLGLYCGAWVVDGKQRLALPRVPCRASFFGAFPEGTMNYDEPKCTCFSVHSKQS